MKKTLSLLAITAILIPQLTLAAFSINPTTGIFNADAPPAWYYIYNGSTLVREFGANQLDTNGGPIPSNIPDMQIFWGQDFTNTTFLETSAIDFDFCFAGDFVGCQGVASDSFFWTGLTTGGGGGLVAANDTWAEGGLWGNSVSTDSVKDTLQASVQTTGAQLWPLLVFSGIALAFIIFLQVVVVTRRSVGVAAFDDKKADELKEFYSKNGGASKDVVDSIRK